MCLRRSNHRVSQWNRKYSYALVLTFTILFGKNLFGQVVCQDGNYNSDNYASTQRKIPSSGSGSGGTLEKRSSYAVISDAFSQTVTNEFGSEFTIIYADFIARDHLTSERIFYFCFKKESSENRWWWIKLTKKA